MGLTASAPQTVREDAVSVHALGVLVTSVNVETSASALRTAARTVANHHRQISLTNTNLSVNLLFVLLVQCMVLIHVRVCVDYSSYAL